MNIINSHWRLVNDVGVDLTNVASGIFIRSVTGSILTPNKQALYRLYVVH